MGNTPSTPPPLVSINAPGNDVLVPYGTSLYACPPPTPGGYHPPYPHGDCHGTAKCRGGAPRGPVYSQVGIKPRRRHGRAEPDVNIRECEEESQSTELGELSEPVRMRRNGSKKSDMRTFGGRRIRPEPYDIDPRPSNAPAGCAGLRGGQEYPGMHSCVDNMGMDTNPCMTRPAMHPGMMYPGVYHPGPGISPHPSVPPQYTSHESMLRYPPGVGGIHNANPYASHPPRPPSPSTSSPPSSPKSPPRRLPPGIQAAIDAAVYKSANLAGKSRSTPVRSETSPATFAKEKNNEWDEGIDTCICTTNCKCRKGERATGWYEGVANIEGEEVPVKGKLSTRWVLTDDLQKDCGDHTGYQRSSSSSSSDTGTARSKKNKEKDKTETKRSERVDKLEGFKPKIDRRKKAAARKQRPRYGPSLFAEYGPGYDTGDVEDMNTKMLQHLRMTRIGNDPYELDRIGGMDATGRMQGIFDPMTTRNLRRPRMPPKLDGMRMRFEDGGFMEDCEDMGGATMGNPYARPSTMNGKGRNKYRSQSNTRAGFECRGGGLSDTDDEPKTAFRRGSGKSHRQIRGGKPRPHFESDDTDLGFGPGRRLGTEGKGSSQDGAAEMYNSPKHGIEGEGENAPPQIGRPRISPPGRRGRARHGRTAGRQAHAETDDDEDY